MAEEQSTIRHICWSDLFPWLRLVRAARFAFAPRNLILAAVGLAAMNAGWGFVGWLFPKDADTDDASLKGARTHIELWREVLVPDIAGDVSLPPVSASVLDPATSRAQAPWQLMTYPFSELFEWNVTVGSFTYLLLCGVWALLVWSLFGAAITRGAALWFAREDRLSLRHSLLWGVKRWPAYFGGPMFPLAGVLIAAGTSRANYLAVAYPSLLALGGVAWERWSAGRRASLMRGALLAVVTLLALPLLPLALPLLPVESFIRYQAALGQRPSTEEHKRLGALPQHYADMFGWDDLVTQVEAAYRRLSPDEQRHAVVFGQNYGEAGAIDVLGRPRGLPRALSGHNQYWLWGPRDWDGSVIIIIGGDRPDNAAFFDRVEIVGQTRSPYAMPYEQGLDISIGRGFKMTPREAWPQLKHYN
jgi:hypothetical protein